MNTESIAEDQVFFDYQVKAVDKEDFENIVLRHGLATLGDYDFEPRPGITLAIYVIHYDFVGEFPDAVAVPTPGYWAVIRSTEPIEWDDNVEIVPPPFLYIEFA